MARQAAAHAAAATNRREARMTTHDALRTGMIGLGAMGLPMGKTLIGKGFDVIGFDLDPARRAKAAKAGLTVVESPAEVFRNSRVIIFSLPAAQHVRSVIDNSGLLTDDMAFRIIIDTSTSEPQVSRDLAEALGARGHGFLDAPVSGGPSGSASGQLSFMVGGDEAHFREALPHFEAMGTKILHVGGSGAGNVAKLVNNMLVACHMLTTAEGLRLAEASGVGAADALRVVNAASGRSMLSEVHFPNWVLSGSFCSGFSAGLMRKDVRLALDLAGKVGADLPMAKLAQEIWAEDASGIANDEDFTRLGDPALGQRTKAETH
ncbi:MULTISPECIES: NAD(P)-dependent oxidoreductase [unclassified Paracoccus (in: a-proteobacteria)]|uniref:NAD(P)-dependent oxidoreductase n=1 Tax=unclassified Paracoccus (in: a-proteobacteria) TaxID=2688777 RepID=UPI0015FFC449|nr:MULTISPECIES: NAD(P)-dependent oxidoreductase [unclassified Paracoccus (in: a-proteobacteria)]MBB1493262.1 NAD(P)-dependent oxidoreductase [Paracoccus sp. MC1854]MBB1499684.1 NAD(P)-dependent oxidoreductase [Paracoccus sp. MC1862]QQO45344.1 NAD(P)-dependent oxidoreductase [Paracoccus sp. MC1862]